MGVSSVGSFLIYIVVLGVVSGERTWLKKLSSFPGPHECFYRCSVEALWALMRNIYCVLARHLSSHQRNLVRGAFRSNLSVSVEKPFVLPSGEVRAEEKGESFPLIVNKHFQLLLACWRWCRPKDGRRRKQAGGSSCSDPRRRPRARRDCGVGRRALFGKSLLLQGQQDYCCRAALPEARFPYEVSRVAKEAQVYFRHGGYFLWGNTLKI